MTTTASLTELEFRRSSPSTLRKAANSGHAADFQKALTRQHRTARQRLEKSMAAAESAILWSVDESHVAPTDRELASLLSGNKKQRRTARKLAVQSIIDGDVRPLGVLVAVDTLIRSGPDLKPGTFAELYCALAQIDEVVPDEPVSDEHDATSDNLLREGELPLVLSLVLSDLKGQAARFKAASVLLREALNAGTDTDGMLHATLTRQADAWLAPFVRSAHWGLAFGSSWMNAKDTDRLADTARSCATLVVQTGLVGRPPEDLRDVDSSPADVVEHAMRSVGIRESSPFASLVRSHVQGKRRPAKKRKRSRHLDVSNQSDWAESAVLRNGLQIDSDLCVVNWDKPESTIDLAVLGTPLLSGLWFSEVMVNGKSVGPIIDWHCSCWFSDDEAAFVELEADPTESIHVVRHVMLSLKDHLGVICESVTTKDADAVVRLTNHLPLAVDPLAVTNSITREIVLHADCVSTRVIPAWLEDDRLQHATGRCEKVDNALVSEGEGLGGIAIPLLFDWHPERQALDADWNRLTVTEARSVQSPQTAAGFRVRIGKKQMLIYRSLRPADVPRAVLGLHTTNETVYGRVKKTGEVAPLVLVEGD